ncbi:MAG: hypothetical protein LBD14_06445, partial [Puniceicoccales bacterium]|nr:hypothetical protein [Puniceicoccales bacterium]
IENIQYPQAASIWIDLVKKEIVKVEETKIPHFTMLNPYFSKPEDLKEIENIKRKHGEINIDSWNMSKVPVMGDDCKNKTAVVFSAFVTSQKSGGEELLNAFHGRTPISFRSNIPDMYVQIAIDEQDKHILWQGIYHRQIFAIINHEGKYRALGLSSRYTTPEGIVELSLVSGSPVDAELQTEKIVPSNAKLTLIALRNLVFQNPSKGSPDTYEEQLLSMSPESNESFARLVKLLNSKKLVYSTQLQLNELILTESGKHHMDFEIIDSNLAGKPAKKLEMESFVLDLKSKTISKPAKSN